MKKGITKIFDDILLKLSPDGVVKDYLTGKEELSLFPESYPVGKNIRDLLPKETVEKIFTFSKRLNGNKSIISKDLTFGRGNAKQIFEVKLLKLNDDDVICFISDITSRENFEKELELLISALEASNNAIVITDVEGVIIWVNKVFSEETGYKYSEVIGKKPSILKSGMNSPVIYEKLWNTIKKGNTWTGGLYNKKKDGTIYFDEQTITPFINYNGEITNFIAIKNDRTSYKKLEDELDLHLKLWDLISDAVIAVDKEFKIITWNKGAEKIFGWKFKEVFGKKITGYVMLDEPGGSSAGKFTDLLKKGEIRDELYQKNKFKKNIFIDYSFSSIKNSGKEIIGYLGLFRDSTFKKKIIDEIRTEKELLNSVFDATSDCIIIFDEKGKEKLFNKSVLKYFNITYDQVHKKGIQNLLNLSKSKKTDWDSRLEKVLSFPRIYKYEDLIDLNNEKRYIESHFFPIRSSSNVNLVGLRFLDITENKTAEKDYMESRNLATLGKMAAYISHELKTPLNSIRMNVDILSGSLDISPERRKSFSIIQREVKRLSKLMKDVLQFSNITDSISLETSIHELINDIKALLMPILNENSIELINLVEDIKISGDPKKLQTVFVHLIENSIDAIKSGGQIKLYSKFDDTGKKFSVYLSDNGCGIKEPDKIFEPFYTTKDIGTGLGLPITKNILNHYKSSIRVVSAEPGSTTFEITFNL